MSSKREFTNSGRQPYFALLEKLSLFCEEHRPAVLDTSPLSEQIRRTTSIQNVEQLISNRRSQLAVATGKSFVKSGRITSLVEGMLKEVLGSLSYCSNMHAICLQVADFCEPAGEMMGDWPVIVYITGWNYSAAFVLGHQYDIVEDHHWKPKNNRLLQRGELRSYHKLHFGLTRKSAIHFHPKQYRWADFGGDYFAETPQIKIAPSDRIGFYLSDSQPAVSWYEQRVAVGEDGFDSDELVGEQILPHGTRTREGKVGVEDIRVACTRFIPRKWSKTFWKNALIDQLVLTLRSPDLAITQLVLTQGEAQDFLRLWPSVDDAIRKLVHA